MRDHCGSHLRLISRPWERCCSHVNDSFEVWGVVPSCWNHWRTLMTSFRRPSAVQNLPSTWKYRSVLIVTDRTFSSSNHNGPMMPCLEMAIQAVNFTECNGLCRQCSWGEVMHSCQVHDQNFHLLQTFASNNRTQGQIEKSQQELKRKRLEDRR